MISSFLNLYSILSFKEKKNFVVLFFVKFFSGLFDMIGIASLVPVILTVTKNKILDTNKYALYIKDLTNFDNETLIIFFVLSSLFLILLNIILRTISIWGNAYVSNNVWYYCVNKIYDYYLNQPYKFHLKTPSNELMEKLVIRANDGIHAVISSTYIIIAGIFTLTFLLLFLLFMNFKIAIFIFVIVTLFYVFIYKKIKKLIDKYGKFVPEFSKKTFKLASQSFRSIKDINIFNNQNFYVNKYSELQKNYKDFSIKISIVNSLPRSIFETVIFILIYSIILFLLFFQTKSLNDIILILGIFAASFQRIVPAAQSIFQGIANLKIANHSFEIIYPDLKEAMREKKSMNLEDSSKKKFKDIISLKKIFFNYEKNNKKSLLEIKNLEIKNNRIIGITGSSGAGKSTFIDIFCGILESDGAEYYLDGKYLSYNEYKKISSNISYVSQFPFIAEDTIINNIALGENPQEIDIEKIKISCALVGLKSFIENELENKYNTFIGEDGIRFSGGQRQRLCLARAIYRDKDILVLDESTNSLDEDSEKSIMQNLKKIFKNKLIIYVTHRISNLNMCDEVITFDNGRIIYKGGYQDFKHKKLNRN